VLHTDPQHTPRSYTLVVRTDRSVESIDREVAAVTRDLDPDLPLYEVRSLSDRIEDTLAPRRFALALVTLFASVAAGLAATGVHGVLAEAASTRRREFGIRMALGGTRRQIIALVLRETATWVTIGLAFGLAVAALARGRLARTGIDFGPHEIVIWLLAAGLLVATSLVALVGPALRITRIDPVDVLAEE
jgi:ABC-type antimicrobial peptide transport system permease subunit